jgi:phage terminase large subunit-like protein
MWRSDEYHFQALLEEKQSYVARNQASVFAREKECRIVSRETTAFKSEWLRFYDVLPEGLTAILAVDPSLPPSEAQIAKGLRGKDFEVQVVWGRRGPDLFLLEYDITRQHDPSWTVATFFRLVSRWRPLRAVVESVAYQRALAWILRKAMEQQRRFIPIKEFIDQTNKYLRIVDTFSGPASAGHLFVRREHTEFIQMFGEYPNIPHDDLLDASAIALKELMGPDYYLPLDVDAQGEEEIPRLVYARRAP